jgi:catechol-2,3-dioxygenase
VEEAKKHLEHLATLPRYCLDLEGHWIEVVSDREGTATWIMDRATGQHFEIRTADLENATRLCVHAETPPTANWQKE